MNKTFVIAEAGANHDRKFEQALKLIDVAVQSGADAVKFQTYSSETLYAKNTPNFAGYKNINKLIKDIELPREWQKDLKEYCDENNIEFMSTPFDTSAVDELYNLGVKRIKIAGFEATDPRIVKYAAATQLPLVITAGIGVDLVWIQKIIDWVVEENSDPNLTFLHGNNAYPTPYEDVCLGQIKKIKETKYTRDISVGISDHSKGILIPPIAVALGATTIEKHYTLSRYLPGPDHAEHALEPQELSNMIKNIRNVELSMRQKESITESEKRFKNARRSVVTTKNLPAGHKITIDDITTKRPAPLGCLEAFNYYDVIGQTLKVSMVEDEVLKTGDLK